MADIVRYTPDDRRAVDAMYRRVFGNDSADASRLRWEWQYRQNPNNPGGTPVIWIAREGPTLVGQYATMPVRLQVHGSEVDASCASRYASARTTAAVLASAIATSGLHRLHAR